jgi:peptide/nickel transport system permease protein
LLEQESVVGQYLLRRMLIAIALIIGSATMVFLLLQTIPGDPVRMFLGDFATEEQVVAVRHEMGLDRSLLAQYLDWLGGLPFGDLGTSLATDQPVLQVIGERLPRTMELVVVSIVLGLLIGIPAGVIAAYRRGSRVDTGVTIATLISLSVPSYVIGTLLVLVFSVQRRWLPSSGYAAIVDDPQRHIELLILPSITLGLVLAASIARMTRSSVLETMNLDYVRTARAKGLSESSVRKRHVIRTGLIPITTTVGIQAGNLLGGTIIVESIFAWPGLSTLLFRGIELRDFPVVQGCVLVISGLFILLTLLVDILNGVIDPRISAGASK